VESNHKKDQEVATPHCSHSNKDRQCGDDDVVEAGILYISLYLGVVFISTVLLTALGVDSLSAFSASAATMGNVGPGFGTVGSMGNFSQIPEVGKWLLTATMLLGRLEIFGLILFLGVKSWK
jgi:trk system potassium uptake protein TrkH